MRYKLLLTGVVLAVVPMVLVTAVVVHNEAAMTRAAIEECGHLAYDDLDHVAQSVAALAASHGELSAEQGYEKLRRTIMDIQVGDTGYVYVLNSKGHYVISKDGGRDGADISGARHFAILAGWKDILQVKSHPYDYTQIYKILDK